MYISGGEKFGTLLIHFRIFLLFKFTLFIPSTKTEKFCTCEVQIHNNYRNLEPKLGVCSYVVATTLSRPWQILAFSQKM